MEGHGFTEERIPVETGDWDGNMTLLYQATPDQVYDTQVQWVMLRLDEADPDRYAEPDTRRYEINTPSYTDTPHHAPTYSLEKRLERTYDKHEGLPLDGLLGYTETWDGDRTSWWCDDPSRDVTRFNGYGEAQEIHVTEETDMTQVDLTATRAPLPGWDVDATLSRGPLPLGECLARVEHETGLAMTDLLDEHIDGTWNW